jgi:hypothetical protein
MCEAENAHDALECDNCGNALPSTNGYHAEVGECVGCGKAATLDQIGYCPTCAAGDWQDVDDEPRVELPPQQPARLVPGKDFPTHTDAGFVRTAEYGHAGGAGYLSELRKFAESGYHMAELPIYGVRDKTHEVLMNPRTGAMLRADNGVSLDDAIAAVADPDVHAIEVGFKHRSAGGWFETAWVLHGPPIRFAGDPWPYKLPPLDMVKPLEYVEVGDPYDASKALVLAVGGDDLAGQLEGADITALVAPKLIGDGGFLRVSAEPSSALYYVPRELYRYGVEGRRVLIVAEPLAPGPRKSDPREFLAETLREDGAQVTIIPPADDAVEALNAAFNTFGKFRRTHGSGVTLDWLYEGVMYERKRHLIFGGHSSGKTMLALAIAAAVIKRGESVVYIDYENGEDEIFPRLYALGCTEDEVAELFYYFPEPDATLDDAAALHDELRHIGPTLVIFDSLLSFLIRAGVHEADSTGVEKWFNRFTPMRLPYATLIIDHTGHNGTDPRNSSRKLQGVDIGWYVDGSFSPERVGKVTLTRKKQRGASMPEKVEFVAGGTPLRFERKGARTLKPYERTAEALVDGMSYSEWWAASKIESQTTFNRHRRDADKAGLVEQRDDGRYYRVRG